MTIIKALLAVVLLGSSGFSMAYDFKCVHEKDTAPPLDQQADQWFKQARVLSKERPADWSKVASLYQQAVEKNHWKAMHNLAELYLRGDGVAKDTNKAIDLYLKMIQLQAPLGYYDMSVMTQRGVGIVQSDRSAVQFLIRAADLGSPQAQTRIGYIYIYDRRKDAVGLGYLKCAERQGYADAAYKLGSYYEVVDENYPVSMHYYQRTAALGERKGAMEIEDVFQNGKFSYNKDKKTEDAYYKVSRELANNPDLRFPNLAKDHPLPPNPVQGYHADKDINWKPTGRDDDY
ncbi:tetratricopeptide repeat protein [Pseudomonas chlororaphis]|uniref:tetratricopeptide repeat protein n=1 Tax=Pseudomonas chlororaphis TaxID=587753 RepID=UPI0023671AB4|nr:tetratricopeptide repeat protein [Pseudomonas chlororaphis]WDG57189.1 tetratricopeptide repeat protein [Pseudomonas chlororaphis]WDH91522.1 tetratricopeptide repeat protein [Pseudomonas chlororaphis]